MQTPAYPPQTISAQDLITLNNNAITTQNFLNKIYPVGSIYMSVNSTSPATLFGGTWERIQDRFLLAAGNTYAAGTTGGEATHTLTVDEMPAHQHRVQTYFADGTPGSSVNAQGVWGPCRIDGDTATVGGNQPHNNMPPFLTVNIWKRTA
jgi:hypothetical protein